MTWIKAIKWLNTPVEASIPDQDLLLRSPCTLAAVKQRERNDSLRQYFSRELTCRCTPLDTSPSSLTTSRDDTRALRLG